MSQPSNIDRMMQMVLQNAPRTAHEMRRMLEVLAPMLNANLPEVGAFHEAVPVREGVTADVVVPVGEGPHPVLVYLHGGGWVCGSPKTHRKLAHRFAEAGYLVFNVDYRLAPEHPFPTPFEDCLAATRWAHREAARFGGDATRLAIGGDSAGGNLSAAVAAALTGDPARPRAALLIYGVFDFGLLGDISLAVGDDPRAAEVGKQMAELMVGAYLGKESPRRASARPARFAAVNRFEAPAHVRAGRQRRPAGRAGRGAGEGARRRRGSARAFHRRRHAARLRTDGVPAGGASGDRADGEVPAKERVTAEGGELALLEISRFFREFMRLEKQRASSGISPEELQRWQLLKRRLGQEFHPDLADEHADQRRSVRVPTLLRVSFPDRRSLEDCLMTNISRGGVFVATLAPEPIGTTLRIAIRIEGDSEDLVVSGVVVSQNFSDGRSGEVKGMALAFENPDPATRARLDSLYEEKLIEAAARVRPGRASGRFEK